MPSFDPSLHGGWFHLSLLVPRGRTCQSISSFLGAICMWIEFLHDPVTHSLVTDLRFKLFFVNGLDQLFLPVNERSHDCHSLIPCWSSHLRWPRLEVLQGALSLREKLMDGWIVGGATSSPCSVWIGCIFGLNASLDLSNVSKHPPTKTHHEWAITLGGDGATITLGPSSQQIIDWILDQIHLLIIISINNHSSLANQLNSSH